MNVYEAKHGEQTWCLVAESIERACSLWRKHCHEHYMDGFEPESIECIKTDVLIQEEL